MTQRELQPHEEGYWTRRVADMKGPKLALVEDGVDTLQDILNLQYIGNHASDHETFQRVDRFIARAGVPKAHAIRAMQDMAKRGMGINLTEGEAWKDARSIRQGRKRAVPAPTEGLRHLFIVEFETGRYLVRASTPEEAENKVNTEMSEAFNFVKAERVEFETDVIRL